MKILRAIKIEFIIHNSSNTYPPPCPWHEVGVFGHRAKRVRRCQYPTINDVNDLRSMLSMMDWSTIVFRADIPSGRLRPTPLRVFGTTFSASNFGFKIGLLFKTPKSTQNRPKSSENRPKRVQNSMLSYNARNPQKMHPSYTKT